MIIVRVTDEMISAGTRSLFRHAKAEPEATVVAIFAAMMRARREPPENGGPDASRRAVAAAALTEIGSGARERYARGRVDRDRVVRLPFAAARRLPADRVHERQRRDVRSELHD